MTGFDNKELTTSLEKHYDKVLSDLKELMLSKFEAIKEAILKADGYTKYRDEKQNEFRKALDDQNLTFTRKADHENLEKQFNIWMSGIKQIQEANFNVAMDAIRKIEIDVEKLKNIKQGASSVWPWIITIVMTLIAIISFFIKFKIV